MLEPEKIKELEGRLLLWRKDPLLFVRENFQVEPDPKQKQILECLVNPAISRIAVQSAVGTGKSCVMAWTGLWFITTQVDEEDDPKGAVVSVSGDNLKDNIWAEFAKWQDRSPLLKKAFTWTSERFYSNERQSTWFISARTWSKSATKEEHGRTLSGLHSGYILYLIDESGEIAPAVLRAAEQGLVGNKWGKIIQCGNPTSHHGMLYDTVTNHPERWEIIRITGDPDDPDRSPRVSAEEVRLNVAEFGRQDPWVKSQFFGEFPPASIDALFSADELAKSQKRGVHEHEYDWAQKRIGVDVALYGDDATVIAMRQGLRAYSMIEMRGASPSEIASRVAMEATKWGAEAIFVDDSGGWGSGVIDQLKTARQPVVGVNFGQRADDPRYKNKRADMFMRMRDWIRRGGVIPVDPTLVRELCGLRYTFDAGKFDIESKKIFKKRVGKSSDRSDGLALTFAIAEAPSKMSVPIPGFRGKELDSNWDPFSSDHS